MTTRRRLDLVRDGAVIASSDEGVDLHRRARGGRRRARLRAVTRRRAAPTYDGTPGAQRRVRRQLRLHRDASARRPPSSSRARSASNALDPRAGTWDGRDRAAHPRSRLLDRRRRGDGRASARDDLDPPVFSMRMEPAVACAWTKPKPSLTPHSPAPGTNPEPKSPGAKPTFAGHRQRDRHRARAPQARPPRPRLAPVRASPSRARPSCGSDRRSGRTIASASAHRGRTREGHAQAAPGRSPAAPAHRRTCK